MGREASRPPRKELRLAISEIATMIRALRATLMIYCVITVGIAERARPVLLEDGIERHVLSVMPQFASFNVEGLASNTFAFRAT